MNKRNVADLVIQQQDDDFIGKCQGPDGALAAHASQPAGRIEGVSIAITLALP
ncbi:MAG: hypothetical protein U1E70_29935 [Acetobacteraceae bacterium]